MLAEKTAKKTQNEMLKVVKMHAGEMSTDAESPKKPKRKRQVNVDGFVEYTEGLVIVKMDVVRGNKRPQCIKFPALDGFEGTCAFDIGIVNENWEFEFRLKMKGNPAEVPADDLE